MKEYYEDIELHTPRILGPFPLEEDEIIAFGRKWDPLPMHTDSRFAAKTGHGKVIASGFHLLAICQKLMIEENPMAIVVGLGIDEVRFMTPGKPGDRLTVKIQAIFKRESKSRPSAGIVKHSLELINQRGETVLTYKGAGMIEKRQK